MSLELTEDGQMRPLNRAGRFWLRLLGPERILRFNAWVDERRPEPKPRCPWTTALGEDRCVGNEGHRGQCETVDYVNGHARSHYWLGINYHISKEPPTN
jgi:hypothetical protein